MNSREHNNSGNSFSRKCLGASGYVIFALVIFLIAFLVASAGASESLGSGKTSKKPDRPPKEYPGIEGLTSAVTSNTAEAEHHGKPPKQSQRGANQQASDSLAAYSIAGNPALYNPMSFSEAFTQSIALTSTGFATAQGQGIPGAAGANTLILYDSTDLWGWLGELYSMGAANLASHFGSWTMQPVAQYQPGQIEQYSATIYIGSTYDEPLPAAFLDDVYNSSKPVIWVNDNIWQLTSRYDLTFADKYGWDWSQFDLSVVNSVMYKGTSLTRDGINNAAIGIMNYSFVDPAKATVLANAVRTDGSTFPWALRSNNLTYIGENPFLYTSETDRLIAFTDLLFDALQPTAPVNHRALVRLEDISPNSDPGELTEAADYLYSQGVPFGFGVSPQYADPLAAQNPVPTLIALRNSPVASTVRYLQSRGGTLLMHGYTHQYSNVINPYDGVTGDDFEFYRTIQNPDHTLSFLGALPEDSTTWALGRLDASGAEFAAAGAGQASIFEVPHYTASTTDYKAVTQRFSTRWERGLYFSGLTTGATGSDFSRVIGQMFPFVVRDIYGSVVLPENIGSYEPQPFYQFPTHTVADILNAADKNLVVRDGFASFYYHPFWGTQALSETVTGLKARGYQFVDPAQLTVVVPPPPPQQPPSNVVPPSITGTTRVGGTLTGTKGSWTGNPTSYSFEWQRRQASGTTWSKISGATGQNYLVRRQDVGYVIRLVVTASNAFGSASAVSAETPVVRRR